MVFVYKMFYDLSNALRLNRFTDQERVELERRFKQNIAENEQNKTKESEVNTMVGQWTI